MRFEKILNTILPKLRQLALKYRTCRADADEDDLLSEMIAHLWEQWRKGDLAHGTESYVVQSCYFHLRNYTRKTKANMRPVSLQESVAKDYSSEGAEDISILDRIPDGAMSVSEYIEKNALYEKIMNNGFNPREKHIVTLLCQGFTVREIGEMLSISHAMVVKHKKNIAQKVSREHASLLVIL